MKRLVEIKPSYDCMVNITGLLAKHLITPTLAASHLADILNIPDEDESELFDIWHASDNEFFSVHLGFLEEFLAIAEIPDENGQIVKSAKDIMVSNFIEVSRSASSFRMKNLQELFAKISKIEDKTRDETITFNCISAELYLISSF